MEKNLLDKLPKALRIKEEIKNSIYSGAYGASGEPFISVRKLAQITRVSLVTAHRIMNMLKDDKLIKLVGNKSYLTYSKKESDANNTEHKTSNTIGMLVTNLENPFFATLSKKVEILLKEKGYKLVIASSNYDFIREQEIIEMFCGMGVDGIISCPGTAPETSRLYASLNLPVLFIGRKLEDINVETVLVNHSSAVQKVVRHFTEQGFKNFAYIGIEELENDPRLDAYKTALVKSGFSLAPENIIKSQAKNFDSVIPELQMMLKNASKPIAVFCFHDLLAIRVIKVCNQLKMEIPKDVAVTGFDNLPIATEIIPSLTTINYPLEEMAEIAIERLIRKINGEKSKPRTSYIEPDLIIRESTLPQKISAGGNNELSAACLLYQFK